MDKIREQVKDILSQLATCDEKVDRIVELYRRVTQPDSKAMKLLRETLTDKPTAAACLDLQNRVIAFLESQPTEAKEPE